MSGSTFNQHAAGSEGTVRELFQKVGWREFLRGQLMSKIPLSCSAKDLYDTLRKQAKGSNTCKETLAILSKTSGYSYSTVCRALKELEEKCWIEKRASHNKYGGKLSNHYYLLVAEK